MHRNYFLIIVGVSLGCLLLIFFTVGRQIDQPLTKEMVVSPRSPFKTYISGVGVVEASSGNVKISAPVNRLVETVPVTVGQKVRKGDILFTLEDNDLEAKLRVQQATYESSVAKVQRLLAFPRVEDIAAAEASLRGAQAEFDLAKSQYEMVLGLPDPRSISEQEKHQRLYSYQQADARRQEAAADLEKVKTGTWRPDLEIAQLEVQRERADLDLVKAEIARTKVRSPIDGTVLQINVHPGEWPPADSAGKPVMVLGNIDILFARVSINQLDAPYFRPNAAAVAYLQGDSRQEFPLEFVRVEPLLVNKQTLTNEITERLDTRVFQIIYRITKGDQSMLVGQQLDVFIERS